MNNLSILIEFALTAEDYAYGIWKELCHLLTDGPFPRQTPIQAEPIHRGASTTSFPLKESARTLDLVATGRDLF